MGRNLGCILESPGEFFKCRYLGLTLTDYDLTKGMARACTLFEVPEVVVIVDLATT